MRKLAAVVAVLVAAVSVHADEHLDHLRMMIRAMSHHGPVIPQPASIGPNAVTINITARSFSFTPSSFSVNQGDVVTINVEVPAGDPSAAGHGLIMETYIDPGFLVGRGSTGSTTFTATTAGTFFFACFQPNCGVGHSSMSGQMVVNAAPSGPAITAVTPNSGSTAGGTPIVITGSGFQSGAAVTIGGIAAKNVAVTSSTTIDATTPVGPATEEAGIPVDVKVINPDGTNATASQAFRWFIPPLAVTSITPAASLTRGGTEVTITGAGFTTAVASSVTFGGVPATDVRVIDAVTMQATAPAHAAGIVDVVVTVGNHSVTQPAAFTYPAPRHRAASH